VQTLGLSFADADECSTKMLLHLEDEWLEELRRTDSRAYALYAASGGRRSPGQVFPSLRNRRRKKRRKMTPQQIMASFRAMFGGPANG
jgi:hypothetical protein